MKISLGVLGHLDFGDWALGLVSATITGAATMAYGAFALVLNDPGHYNLQNPTALFETAGTMALLGGAFHMVAFLREKPVPSKTVTTTVTDTSPVKAGSQTVTKVETVQEVPLVPPPVIAAPFPLKKD